MYCKRINKFLNFKGKVSKYKFTLEMLPKCKFTHEYLSNVNKEMIVNKQLKVNKLQLLDLDNLKHKFKVEMVPKLILNKLQLLDLEKLDLST